MKIIHILSCRYSGSTILDYMLGSHSKALSLTELRAFIVGGRKPFTCKSCQPPESCPIYSPDFTEKLLRIGARPEIYDEISRKSGADILIDSSKSINWCKKTLKHTDPKNILFVHISKSPEEYGGSERNKSHPSSLSSVDSIGNKWWRQNTDILRFLYFSPYRAISVRYQDLIENPRKILEEILSYIDAEYEAGMENFWNYHHHPLWGNKGTRSHLNMSDSNPAKWVDESEKNKHLYLDNHQKLFLDEKWRDAFNEKELTSLYTVGRVSQIAEILGYKNPHVWKKISNAGKPLSQDIKSMDNFLQELVLQTVDFINWPIFEFFYNVYHRKFSKWILSAAQKREKQEHP